MNTPNIGNRLRVGLERVVDEQADLLRGRRFGMVMNRAPVDRHLRLAGSSL